MFQKDPKWSNIFLNGPKWSLLVQDGPKWNNVVQNGEKKSKRIQYSPKWSNNCQNWYNMIQFDPRSSKIVNFLYKTVQRLQKTKQAIICTFSSHQDIFCTTKFIYLFSICIFSIYRRVILAIYWLTVESLWHEDAGRVR